jgi:hypothetical protein
MKRRSLIAAGNEEQRPVEASRVLTAQTALIRASIGITLKSTMWRY